MHLTRQTAMIFARGTALMLCFLSTLIFSATLSAETTTEAASGLTPFEVSYTASVEKGVSLNGSAKRTLTSKGHGIWLFRTDVNSFIADIDESLVLKWNGEKVIPLRYRYRLSGFLIKDRKQSIDFDWDKGTATGEYRGKPFKLELKDGTLDPMGFQLQLYLDIKAGKRDMVYEVIDRGSYDTDHFAVVDEEPLKTDSGTIATIKAEKVRENSKRKTLMWFAPDDEYLLVRLQQTEPDGSKYELNLKDAQLGN